MKDKNRGKRRLAEWWGRHRVGQEEKYICLKEFKYF